MNSNEDSTQPDFWNTRYASGKTPWDLGGIPAPLAGFLERNDPSTVLIPGCGAGYEVAAFHAAGWKVTAIDFSPVAVDQARRRLGSFADLVILGDFFQYRFPEQFDVVYERTFLCSLPPTRWPDYVDRMHHVLCPETGRLIGIFLYGEEPEPPPFPLNHAEADRLFSPHFALAESYAIPDSLPLFANKEKWQVWSHH